MTIEKRASAISFALVLIFLVGLIGALTVRDTWARRAVAQGDLQRESLTCSEYSEMAGEDVNMIVEVLNNQDNDVDGLYTVYFMASFRHRAHEDVIVPAICEDANYAMRAFFGGLSYWAAHLVFKLLDPGNADLYEIGVDAGDARVDAARLAITGE